MTRHLLSTGNKEKICALMPYALNKGWTAFTLSKCISPSFFLSFFLHIFAHFNSKTITSQSKKLAYLDAFSIQINKGKSDAKNNNRNVFVCSIYLRNCYHM